MAKKNKDEIARLELEEQIQEAIKRSTANLTSFAEAQKKIVENYKLIQKINLQIEDVQDEINTLTQNGTKTIQQLGKIEQERLKYLISSLDGLEQQKKLIISTNKELSKNKNLVKAVGNELWGWAKTLKSQFVPSLSEAFNKFLSLNDLAIQTSVNIGLSGNAMKSMVSSIEDSQSSWGDLGFELESSARMQQALTDQTGRQVILSQQAQQTAAKTAKALNMQADELGGLVGQMDQFGLGSELAMSSIMDMRVQSEKMGVNSGKVIKKFEQNLGLMNKLNFKSGIKGMQKMAQLSEKYKIEMTSVAAMADKAFKPEGAIDMAAQLQVLGGSLASLGDPFRLMYEARNNPEKLMEDITKAARASASFDPKTKEFKVSAYEMDRLRVAAEATGISMEELVTTAKQGAKIDMFESMLSGRGLKPEEKAMLTGMMEMTKEGAKINGKLVSEMSDKDLTQLLKRSEDLEKLQQEAMSAQAELTGIKNMIMVGFVKFFTENKELIKDFLSGIKSLVGSIMKIFSPTGLVATTLGLYFGSKILWPIVQGRIFGMNAAAAINAGTTGTQGKGGILSRMFGKGGGGNQSVSPSTQNVGGNLTGQSQQMGQLTNSTSQLGKSASVSAPQILALGAALLMVGGAIWLASEGLSTLVKSFEGLTGPQALGAVSSIVTVMGGFVAIIYAMIPAITALGAVSAPVAIPLLALGASLLMIGGAVALAAYGMSILVDSFTKMFSVIGDNGSSLLMAGLGFISMATGIQLLSLALLSLSATSLLAIPGLLMLGVTTSMIVSTAESINNIGGGEGIKKTVEAINSVDTDKINALKDLSKWMTLLGATTTIKFDESLEVKGSIQLAGQAGGKTNTDWVNDPIFVSKLKEIIISTQKKDLKGGKA
jgi:hypothetical protein